MSTDSPGALLRRFRTARGLSQQRVADLAGIARPYLSQIEGGQRGRAETLTAICDALGLTAGERGMLLGGEAVDAANGDPPRSGAA